MIIKIGGYTLPENFMAFSNVGENNKRYIDIIGVLTGSTMKILQAKIDKLVENTHEDSYDICLALDTRRISAVKNSPEAITFDMNESSPTAVIKLTYRAEDKSIHEILKSVYVLTNETNVLVEGNDDTYPIMTVHFTGGSSILNITNTLTSQAFELSRTFAAGDTLIVDSVLHEMKLNGLILIPESEDAEYIRLQKGINPIEITTDNAAGLLIEFEEKYI